MKTIETTYTGYDNYTYPAKASAIKEDGKWRMIENQYLHNGVWVDTGDEWTQAEMIEEFEEY